LELVKAPPFGECGRESRLCPGIEKVSSFRETACKPEGIKGIKRTRTLRLSHGEYLLWIGWPILDIPKIPEASAYRNDIAHPDV
jgi:hypothetical protein